MEMAVVECEVAVAPDWTVLVILRSGPSKVMSPTEVMRDAARAVDEPVDDGPLASDTVTKWADPASSVRLTTELMLRRALEDPASVADDDPQPARSTPTRTAAAPSFPMAKTVPVATSGHRRRMQSERCVGDGGSRTRIRGPRKGL